MDFSLTSNSQCVIAFKHSQAEIISRRDNGPLRLDIRNKAKDAPGITCSAQESLGVFKGGGQSEAG